MADAHKPAAALWWQSFFDADYLRVWGPAFTAEQSAAQADLIWKLLGLREGSRVLDVPCGYGRLSRPLAERGAVVLGVDQSADLLAAAERDRGTVPQSSLRYMRHDLRQPLRESGFDAAFNLFSSFGYGPEEDDLAIFRTLHHAVRPGGILFVETNHRDAVVAFFARQNTWAKRRSDGTIVIEEPQFDPITGRVNTTWYWSGPQGSGQKSASLRVYTATELIALLARAGWQLQATHTGLFSMEAVPDKLGDRLGLLLERAQLEVGAN